MRTWISCQSWVPMVSTAVMFLWWNEWNTTFYNHQRWLFKLLHVYFWSSRFGHIVGRPIMNSLLNQTSWMFSLQSSLCSTHSSQKHESCRNHWNSRLTRCTCFWQWLCMWMSNNQQKINVILTCLVLCWGWNLRNEGSERETARLTGACPPVPLS